MKLAYRAFDKGGKAVTSTIEANSAAEAADMLRLQGLFVAEIKAGEDSAVVAAAPVHGKKVGSGKRLKNLTRFTRQLHVLVSSGTPMVQALIAIERQSDDKSWCAVVADIRTRVEEGAPLSLAMEEHSEYFDAVSQSLVAAGESSGDMGSMLARLADMVRKQMHLRSSIVGALVYPILLIFVGIAVLAVMLLFVLPRFGELFLTLDVPLPPTTRALLFLSAMLYGYWWAALLALGAAFFGLRSYLRSAAGRTMIHTMTLRLPKIGALSRSLLTAQFARLLGVLLESKVPLVEALVLTRQAARNIHYTQLLQQVEEAVGRGESLSVAMNESPLINPAVLEAIRNGEQSGQVGRLLLHIADFLDEENEIVVKSLTSIMEPIILLGLGAMVGVIAVSMFMPLFDLAAMAQGG